MHCATHNLWGHFMRVFKIFTAAMLVSTVSIGALHAKSLRSAGEPFEFPPSSYKGKQYVDSKGCVFIRAGISGSVTWVPRVSRSRQQVCRQKPTFASAPRPDVPFVADVTPPAPKPTRVRVAAPTPAPKPVVRTRVAKPIPAPKPVVRTRVAKPAPAPKPVVRTRIVKSAPAPAPKRVVRAPVAQPMFKPAPQPKRIVRRVVQTPVVAAPKPVLATAPVAAPKPTQRRVAQRPTRRVATGCRNASTFSQAYTNSSGRLAVRCGPQAKDPTGGYVHNTPTARTPRAQTRRVETPRPTRTVALTTITQRQQVQSTQRVVQIIQPRKPPAGYQQVWTDGRDNPNRARGTAAGKAQMDMVWTATVPRRLIAVSTSQDTRRRIAIRLPKRQARNVTIVSTKSHSARRRAARSTSGADMR